MEEQSDEYFTRLMRKVTRESHDISDALVNSKMAVALSDNSVWAEGLLVFYEIFAYLEQHVPPEILPVEFHRKAAFEKDLDHFLGTDWKTGYTPRQAVQDYLDHLEEVTKENPDYLIAYVYHLYMGLLSGAQILQKKRAIAHRLNPLSSATGGSTLGAESTHFENYSVSELKKKMRKIVNDKAKELDEVTKKRVLKEGLKVFELNNKIVSTVRGVNRVVFKKLIIATLVCLLSYLVYKIVF